MVHEARTDSAHARHQPCFTAWCTERVKEHGRFHGSLGAVLVDRLKGVGLHHSDSAYVMMMAVMRIMRLRQLHSPTTMSM